MSFLINAVSQLFSFQSTDEYHPKKNHIVANGIEISDQTKGNIVSIQKESFNEQTEEHLALNGNIVLFEPPLDLKNPQISAIKIESEENAFTKISVTIDQIEHVWSVNMQKAISEPSWQKTYLAKLQR